MKLKTEMIVAIKTQINGVEVFIESFSKRQDDKFIPNYTDDQNLAHDFGTDWDAIRNIDKIINYSNYRYEPVTVEAAEDTQAYLKFKRQNTAKIH